MKISWNLRQMPPNHPNWPKMPDEPSRKVATPAEAGRRATTTTTRTISVHLRNTLIQQLYGPLPVVLWYKKLILKRNAVIILRKWFSFSVSIKFVKKRKCKIIMKIIGPNRSYQMRRRKRKD